MSEWRRIAACRGMGPEIFYPPRWDPAATAAAKAVCARCPVVSECAQAGRREKFGIWGGVGERTRKKKRSA